MTGRPPVDPHREARRDYLALLNEVGMIPGLYRPGMTRRDRWLAGEGSHPEQRGRVPGGVTAGGQWAARDDEDEGEDR